MSPPDLGGGKRRSRRPGSFCVAFFMVLLLFSFPFPPSTLEQFLSGDSESLVRDRLIAPLGFRSADLEFHCPSCSCMAGLASFRSEGKEPYMFDPNPRSDSYPSCRLCTLLSKTKKSTKGSITSLSRCSSHRCRYHFPTPFVPNSISKFLEDTGVLYGVMSVMEENLSAHLCHICLNRYNLEAVYQSDYVSVFFSSPSLDEPFSELLSHYKATNFTDSTLRVAKSESYRKQGNFQATARIYQGALGRTAWILGHGPKIVTVEVLIRMGQGPNIKTIQKTVHRILGFKFLMYGLLLCLKTYCACKMGLGFRIESLDFYSPKM